MIPTLSAHALERMTAIRNSESINLNLGAILATEICYIAIIPFAVVEAAFWMLGMTAVLTCIVPLSIIFLDDDFVIGRLSGRFAFAVVAIGLTVLTIKALAVNLLWASSAPVMNVLPVKMIQTGEQAERFFCC